ncbi:hypothetical protein ACNKHM_19480 [Shigella sonnei]
MPQSDASVTMPLVDNQLDLATFWQQWLSWQAPVNQRAWAFHDALAQGFAALMREQATMRGITTLVFSGGVIHNRLLRARLAHISLISHCSLTEFTCGRWRVVSWAGGYCCGALVGRGSPERIKRAAFGHHCRMRRNRLSGRIFIPAGGIRRASVASDILGQWRMRHKNVFM